MTPQQRWAVEADRAVSKVLKHLPRDLQQRLRTAMRDLRQNPRPHGVKALKGTRDLYRIRVGDWRIIYEIRDEELVVLVIRIAPRGAVYEDL